MSEERDIKGIWIPIDIWDDPELTIFETFLLAEIDSLDRGEGCWKRNQELAKRMRCSVVYLEARISSLRKRKYLKTIKKEKHRRYLRTRFSRHLVNNEPIRDKGLKPLSSRVDSLSTIKIENTSRCGTGAPPCIFPEDMWTESTSSKKAIRLTKLFYELLVRERLSQSRSDLPYIDLDKPKEKTKLAREKRKATFRKWARLVDELIHQEQGHQTIRRVMRWYFENHRKTHVGSYYALTTFCENYPKIEKMMRRAANGNGEHHENQEPQDCVERVVTTRNGRFSTTRIIYRD
jgi:hypothetical protein